MVLPGALWVLQSSVSMQLVSTRSTGRMSQIDVTLVYLLDRIHCEQCCCFLYQNPVWRATGKKSADSEEDGRHVGRDHPRPAVLSAAGKTYR